MFTPSRLTLARERRRLTKKSLAEAVGVNPHTILRYEIGETEPPEETLRKIASVLEFPVDFFFQPDVERLATESASFRSMSAMSPRERDAALAAGSIAYMLADWVDQRFDLPKSDLIDLGDDTPEVAARSLREKWGLGERPIRNITHLLESKGARLFSLAENTLHVDAFSAWRGDIPYVFLNTMKSAERGRHDGAHELGHLVLHRHGGPTGRKAEDEANQFASSFLMPEEDVRATLPRIHTLNQIIEAKRRWGVSVMSLIVRLQRLGIMTDWQYRRFCIDATELGYRTSEPFGLSREHSAVWQKVLTTLWTERVTKEEIAMSLYLPTDELENLLFGLAGARGTEIAGSVPPPLKLISQ